ncbi:MAG TPA: YeeE/YedE family protein [Geminicoccaceae bacterium]|nr:YeeE/YedE family protein [Geminicoccaceae bacterium]
MLVATAAFLLGLVYGAVVQRTHFCTMGAIADAVLFGSRRRLRSWLLAIAVALAGTQALALAGLVPLDAAFYRGGELRWLAALVGGTLFGFGMVLAGGCVSRNLVRLGAGSLKSLVVLLVLGVTAYAAMRGALAVPRGWIAGAAAVDLRPLGLATQGLDTLVATGLGVPPALAAAGLAAVLVALVLWYCLKDAGFLGARRELVAGLVVGALVPLGWLATAQLGELDFDPLPPASLTYVAPTGATVLYLMTATGAAVDFAVALVVGTVLGAFATALATRQLRLETFTSGDDMLRHLAGAVLMGAGGVLAGGCSIGQGITGLSTLALGSFVAVGGIALGAVWALDYLESGRLLAWPARPWRSLAGHLPGAAAGADARRP